MAGKSQGIIYGKVQIFSDTETLDSMKKTLVGLLTELGYPETEVEMSDEELLKGGEEEGTGEGEGDSVVEELTKEDERLMEEELNVREKIEDALKKKGATAPWTRKR